MIIIYRFASAIRRTGIRLSIIIRRKKKLHEKDNLSSSGGNSSDIHSEGGKHTLRLRPSAHLDRSWVSCLVTTAGYVLSSSTTFPLAVKHFPSHIKMSLLNGIKLGESWLVQGLLKND